MVIEYEYNIKIQLAKNETVLGYDCVIYTRRLYGGIGAMVYVVVGEYNIILYKLCYVSICFNYVATHLSCTLIFKQIWYLAIQQ